MSDISCCLHFILPLCFLWLGSLESCSLIFCVTVEKKSWETPLFSFLRVDSKAVCSPVLCPLSAGIGRTGCFIVSSIGCQQLRETGQADILETVCQLRLDRLVTVLLSVSPEHDSHLNFYSIMAPVFFAEVAWSKPQSSTSSCTPHWPSTAASYITVRYPLGSSFIWLTLCWQGLDTEILILLCRHLNLQ